MYIQRVNHLQGDVCIEMSISPQTSWESCPRHRLQSSSKKGESKMRKLTMAFLVGIALFTMVFAGCVTSAKAFADPSQVINTKGNQEFTIALGSNISTGYSWQAAFDEKALTLIEKTYKEQDSTGKQIVGASGTEYFKFKSLSKGETKVTFTYRRPWEQPSAQDQTLVFSINVK